MFFILNYKNEFYSHTENGIEFTTDFAKATMFDTRDIAMTEWDENGTDDILVHIEYI